MRSLLWRSAETASLRALRSILALRAGTLASSGPGRTSLVLAPHPDDETLGCGGLMLRRAAEGARVHVLMATDGGASHRNEPTRSTTRAGLVELRREELLSACALLGVDAGRVHCVGLEDGALGSHRGRLEAAIAEALDRIAPDEVFVCALDDGHDDHKALAVATRAVIDRRPAPARPRLYEYPVWFWNYRSWRRPGLSNTAAFRSALAGMLRTAVSRPVVAVDISGARQTKRAALAQHRSQLGLLPEEPAWSGLPASFLRFFFRTNELFFPIDLRDAAFSQPAPAGRVSAAHPEAASAHHAAAKA